MKKTPISGVPGDFPAVLHDYIEGTRVYDSSCSPEARVYFIDSGYYLKTAARGTLEREYSAHSFGFARMDDVFSVRTDGVSIGRTAAEVARTLCDFSHHHGCALRGVLALVLRDGAKVGELDGELTQSRVMAAIAGGADTAGEQAGGVNHG